MFLALLTRIKLQKGCCAIVGARTSRCILCKIIQAKENLLLRN